MKENWTKGEWFINRKSKDVLDGGLSIEVAGDYFIAQVDPSISQEANAHLMKAAPKLYEALKESCEMLERIMSNQDWGSIEEQVIDNLKALAAARGEDGNKPD